MRKSFLIILTLAGLANACFDDADLSRPDRELFEEFVVRCRGGGYPNGKKEYYYQIFAANLKTIRDRNQRWINQGLPVPNGINGYADWTEEQFHLRTIWSTGEKGFLNDKLHQISNLNTTSGPCTNTLQSGFVQFTKNVTWQNEACMTSMKYQGNCASDYAFMVTDNIADNYCLKSGEYCELSAQQLIDCSGEWGCRGGFQRGAFDYINNQIGLMRRDQYEYTRRPGTCQYNPSKAIHKDIVGINYLENSENAIREAIDRKNVVIVAIDARNWQFITGDVIIGEGYATECCLADENKYVQIVGYGRNARGTNYWIFKNSWGVRWGNRGYGKLLAGVNCYRLLYKAHAQLKTLSGECIKAGPPMVRYPDEDGGNDLPDGPPVYEEPVTDAPLPPVTKDGTEPDYPDETDSPSNDPTSTTDPTPTDLPSPTTVEPSPTTTLAQTTEPSQSGCTNQCGKQSKWRMIWKIIDSLQLDAEECEV